MKPDKFKIVFWEVPAVVHCRAQQPVGAKHIKQGAKHALPGTQGLIGTPIHGLEVFDNGGAISNDFALGCHQGWNRGQLCEW